MQNQKQFSFDFLDFDVVYSKRKTLTLSLTPKQTILVKAPLRTSANTITNFISKHQNWINKRKQQIAKRFYLDNLKLQNGERIPIFDHTYYLQKIQSNKTHITLLNNSLLFSVSKRIQSHTHQKHFIQALCDFALPIFKEQLKECAQNFPNPCFTKPPSLKIKNMKSQWGNYYKAKHCMTLNLHLLHYSKQCLKSVIIHELCHTKYRGHGPKFYNLMNQAMPNWKQADAILKGL